MPGPICIYIYTPTSIHCTVLTLELYIRPRALDLDRMYRAIGPSVHTTPVLLYSIPVTVRLSRRAWGLRPAGEARGREGPVEGCGGSGLGLSVFPLVFPVTTHPPPTHTHTKKRRYLHCRCTSPSFLTLQPSRWGYVANMHTRKRVCIYAHAHWHAGTLACRHTGMQACTPPQRENTQPGTTILTATDPLGNHQTCLRTHFMILFKM